MIHVSQACKLAMAALEEADMAARARRNQGGIAYRVVDPRKGQEATLIVPAGDERDKEFTCGECFDEGLVSVLVDGGFNRVRCGCSAGDAFRETVAAHRDVFPPAVESYYHPEPPEPPEPEMPVEESGQVDIWAPQEPSPEELDRAARFLVGQRAPQYGQD